MPYYAVCTECDFLRVLTEHAERMGLPEVCPKCGGEMMLREKGERFEPTYVGRVARSLARTEL
jgi:hypothetical protein